MRPTPAASLLAGLAALASPAWGAGLEFFPLAPCRLVDTRGPNAPTGGPALDDGEARVFPVVDHCGIPSSAVAVSVIYDSGVTSTEDPQWQTKFEVPYQEVDLDFWAALGNHDYGGNGAGNEFTKGQHEVDYTQVSAKWKMPDNFYRKTFEHVEFFALDTNLQLYGMDADQESAVPAWLSASTARWKIAFGHHYLSNGPHGNAGSYDGTPGAGAGIKNFFDDHICGEVDVYLSGHDHSLQWLTDSTCAELLVSGGGASTTTLTTNNVTRFQAASLGFLYVEIVGDSLTGQFIGTNGAVLFERTLVKP